MRCRANPTESTDSTESRRIRKNLAPPREARLQVPSAFAPDLSVCDATVGRPAGGNGGKGVEAANSPII
jgi:hypothetical protein